jgi:hypothetical protein
MNNLSAAQLFITETAKALLNKPVNSPFLNLSQYKLWEVKGRDSLQLVKRLVSDVVAKVGPFQSIDFIFTGYQYSVLRLGDGNFRLGLYGELGTYGGLNFEEAIAQAKIGLQVEAKSPEISAIALTLAPALDLLPKIAVVQPPQRLEALPSNYAVAARIDENSVLIWRHQLLSQSVFELHTTVGDIEAIKVKLINIDRSPLQLRKLLE